MLNWLRRRAADKHRRIYQFWDGSRKRRVDPVQTFFALQAHPTFNAAVHCQLCDEGDREATQITCQAVRDVFSVTDYCASTGHGLTLGEQLGLLADFYIYLEQQKKSTASWPTSPSSTEASTSSVSTSETTPPSSDCGPVASEPTCDVATPSV